MKKRSASFSGVIKSEGGTMKCYGVSQGYYAVKTGVAIGTSSLGSCFALIATRGAKVFLAHVQAGTTATSLVEAVAAAFGDEGPKKVLIVRGAGYSDSTDQIIEALAEALKPELETSASGSVVMDFSSLSKPANIEPTNRDRYRANNLKGGALPNGSAIVAMDD